MFAEFLVEVVVGGEDGGCGRCRGGFGAAFTCCEEEEGNQQVESHEFEDNAPGASDVGRLAVVVEPHSGQVVPWSG